MAVPLTTVDPEAEFADLGRLRELIGDARIVALGEGAHNVTEFYRIKDRILRFLVRELGFTAFVMESGYAEGLTVAEWIRGGTGPVDAVARDGITYRFGECEPMRRQLEWMRRQNGRVRFYGMDLPGSSTSPGSAVRACLARMPRHPGDEELLRLSELGGRTEAAIRLDRMPAAERFQLLDGLTRLEDRAAVLGDEIAIRCAASLHAFVEELAGPVSGPYPRDVFMADTVRWIADREDRIVVSAHNAHVQRTPFLGRTTVGGMLPADGVVVIGTTYGTGPEVRFTERSARPFDCDVTLEQRVPPPNSIEARLDRLGYPIALVEPADMVAEGMLSNGEFVPTDCAAAYDALIHFREVHRIPGAFERLRAEFTPEPA
ncbi:erythromycin esterase family protein [Kribbella sp.]|uniref:erythromycin esterase family protein n=1 Tax=Kribbella sp. TaxID=1871183 RepID=UPI002D49618E|nr:erythromycin esterase family protein [Kribbella sp.]HZX07122.1 erythromycin esterase family protein [Kribbella sp.]